MLTTRSVALDLAFSQLLKDSPVSYEKFVGTFKVFTNQKLVRPGRMVGTADVP